MHTLKEIKSKEFWKQFSPKKIKSRKFRGKNSHEKGENSLKRQFSQMERGEIRSSDFRKRKKKKKKKKKKSSSLQKIIKRQRVLINNKKRKSLEKQYVAVCMTNCIHNTPSPYRHMLFAWRHSRGVSSKSWIDSLGRKLGNYDLIAGCLIGCQGNYDVRASRPS